MNNTTVAERLKSAFPKAIQETYEAQGQLNVRVERSVIVDVARFLQRDPELQYNFLENLCAVDYLGRDPRFEVVYHLLSFTQRHRVCLKVGLPEADPTIPSLTDVWLGANWPEREAFDMFGIMFNGHPSLTRILMPDDWDGHPQRKDVPLGGEEVAFTFNEAKIYVHKPFAKEER